MTMTKPGQWMIGWALFAAWGAACGGDGTRLPPPLEIVTELPAMPDADSVATIDVAPDGRSDTGQYDLPTKPDLADIVEPPPDQPALPDVSDTTPDHVDSGDAPNDSPGTDAEVAADLDAARTEIETVTPPLDPLVVECKQWLAKAEPYMALQAAEQRLAVQPDDPDALFCAALAGMIDRTEFGLSLITLLDMASTYASGKSAATEPTWNEYLAAQLHSWFSYLHEGYELALERLDRLTAVELAFDVEAAWVYYASRPVLSYQGRFDRGDILLMRTVCRFIMGFLDIFRGQDFRTDAATMISFIIDDFLDSLNVPNLLRAIAYLMVVDPHFLSLHPDDGAAAFEEARQILSNLGADLRMTLQSMADLPERDPADEVSTCRLQNGTFTLILHSRVEREEATGTLQFVDIRFILNEELFSGIDAVSASVANPGQIVSFQGGLRYVFALMLSALLESGMLGDLSLGGFQLRPGLFTPLQLAGILDILLPVPAAFDLGTFYMQPVGLRALLPRPVAYGGFGADHFAMEWECPGDLGPAGWPQGWQEFLCQPSAELVDAPHFVATPDELPPDSYMSILPYMVWDDPTLGGLLYADLSDVLPGAPAGFLPTDGTTINIVLAEALKQVLPLLSP